MHMISLDSNVRMLFDNKLIIRFDGLDFWMSSLTKNMIFNTFGGLWYQGCLWLITVLVVKLSSNYEYSGMLALGMTVGNMLSALGTFNVRIFQVTDDSNQFDQRIYIAFRIITLLLSFVPLTIYAFFISNSSECFFSIIAFLIFKVDESFVDVLYGIDQCHEHMDYIGISQLIRGLGFIAFFIVSMQATKSLPISLIAMTVPCLATTIFFDIKIAGSFDRLVPSFDWGKIQRLFLDCLPLVVSIFLFGMIVSISRQIYGIQYGTNRLGIYAAVATPAVLIQAGARFLYAPLMVPMSRLFCQSRNEFKRNLINTSVLMAIISTLVVIVLSAVGPTILRTIYGESISQYVSVFSGVLVCSATSALLYFISDVLVMCRFIKWNFFCSVTGFFCALVFSCVFETLFDMNGINIAVTVSNVIVIFLAYVFLLANLKES